MGTVICYLSRLGMMSLTRDNEQNRTRSSYAMARKRAMKWTDLHLRPRVESITDDNVESNCSMIRKYSSKRSEFLRFNLYFCHVYRWIFFFFLQH